MIYINKDAEMIYVELEALLDQESNYVGSTWDDYKSGAWVLLTDEQVSFRNANPNASVEEVFNMQLTPTPVRTLEQAVQEKIWQIEEYDRSGAVNSFRVNGISDWLTPDTRANYKNSIEAAELLGETHITFMIAGIVATSTLQDARIMLAKIQRYADRCTLVTETHKATVSGLLSTTVEEVDAYDYTAGYPDKESFDLVQIKNMSEGGAMA